MFVAIKKKFKDNPLLYYALSICATWAGIGSLMNGVVMTQTYGVIPSLIWAFGNSFACVLFGLVALRIPKVREVFRSKPMMWACGIMCIFQSWLSMNGTQTVFADTVLGTSGGTWVAYGIAIFFLIILLRFGMIRNVLTDGFGWLTVYALAVVVTIAALIYSHGHLNAIGLGLEPENMRAGIWKAFLLLPGPFTYPYFFRILDYNEKNAEGVQKVNTQRAFALGGLFFGIYMAITFLLAWAQFNPALALLKAILITLIGASTLSSAMYSIYIAFGRRLGLCINLGLVLLWHILIPLGVMGMWTLMASVRVYFVGAGILAALVWHYAEKRKAVHA